MRRWGIRVLLATLVLAASSAWAAQGKPFAQVQRAHWSYDTIERLENAGYYTGAPKGAFAGTRQFTRYEFAVTTERIYRSLQTRALSAVDPTAMRADIAAYLKLLDEFAAEIADLGPDVAAMRKELQAQDDRLFRQQQSLAANPIVRAGSPTSKPSRAASLSITRNSLGLRGALQDTLMLDSLPQAPPLRAKPGTEGMPTLQPGITANLGPINFAAEVRPNSDLETPDDAHFVDPSDRFNSLLEAGIPLLGRSLVSAFYSRSSSRFDRYGLMSPQAIMGPTDTLGGGVSGLIGSRVGYNFQGVQFLDRADGSGKGRSFSGGLSYQWGSYDFAIGYEQTRLRMLGGAGTYSAYTAGFGRSISSNARFDLRLRFYGNLGNGGGRGDAGSSSAITSFTVRF
jgi:hypothetical protein